jgi:hypothetical protein
MEVQNSNRSLPDDAPPDGSHINQMVVLQPGERVVCQIKRHPIGLIGIYFSAALVSLIVIGGAFITTSVVPDLSQQAKTMLVLAAAIVLGITLLYTYIAAMIYGANRWIVTSDSLTQITQVGLFNKQTSQLSLNDLEDVTVQQTGLLQSMFSYGTLRAETAGERSKFLFQYCPKPNFYARQILVAREDFMNGKRYTEAPRQRPPEGQSAYRHPSGYAQQYPQEQREQTYQEPDYNGPSSYPSEHRP